MLYNAFISCPKYIEPLLADELLHMGEIEDIKQQPGGVLCRAGLRTLYKVCLWSRLANRVLLQISTAPISSKQDLREWLLQIEWAAHMEAQQSLHIRFFGRLPGIDNTQFGAQFAKDAIVDYFRNSCGLRPVVDKVNPDVRFQVNIDAGHATVYVDLSGESLHQRGYRQGVTEAPLKENLAAAILLRAGWPVIAARGGALIDNFCGGGTFLIEGALMAANIAPGLYRARYGFQHWLQHDPALWTAEKAAAEQVRHNDIPPMIGYDQDARALGVAEKHIEVLHLGNSAPRVYRKTVDAWRKPNHIALIPGLLLANPPYGERMGHKIALQHLYFTLGERWLAECSDWRAAIFTASADLMKATRLYWNKEYAFYNGGLECKLYLVELARGSKEKHFASEPEASHYTGIDIAPFLHRLQKNLKHLKRWRQRENIHCYRLYDADIPEFAVAIDIYANYAHVQEYKAPGSIAPEKAAQRLAAIRHALPQVLELPAAHIFLKQRAQQKGKQQYVRQARNPVRVKVREGGVELWVDLSSYLDSGLFLDHRPLRLKLAQICAGKRFLNLFCYTAAATVHAAKGGAVGSVSVDMSNAYLQWAQDNFELNNIDTRKHVLLRADVMTWLTKQHAAYDVIFLDPPTFSNSKRMQGVLDVQRDHVELIERCMHLLRADGVLYFSTNFRRFSIDAQVSMRYKVKDISAWSIPEDFARNRKIHACFEISKSRA